MPGGRERLPYSVDSGEIDGAIAGSECVRLFLAKHERGSSSWLRKAHGLLMFFKWLRVKKGSDLSP